MTPWFAALLVGAAAGILIHSLYRNWRAKRTRVRRVEGPNSAYTSALVRQGERRERWHRIAMNTLHPLNRTEVEHLLQLVAQGGVDALNERQRTFLDTLADRRS